MQFQLHTKRVFALICVIFFGFLLLMVSKTNFSSDSSIKEYKRRSDLETEVKDERFLVLKRPPIIHPKQLKMDPRPGEQLPFQPQPPPILNASSAKYSYLGIERPVDSNLATQINAHLKKIHFNPNAKDECKTNISLADYWFSTQNKVVPIQDSWEKFYAQIGTCDLYHDEELIEQLLKDMSTLPIKRVDLMDGGTQIKLVFTFSNEKQAVFKPMRFGRDYETDPNHFYFGDFERHNAEIATFHLDRILGYRRAVPTVGRVLNITSELYENAERKLKKTFFISPVKNRCFVGKCDYYCDTTHAICGAPDLKEGSVQAMLPDDENVPRKHNRSPYRRTYSKKNQLAIWQQDMNYCEWKVKTKKVFAHGRRLLDLVDLHILDYLIGNQDRHHYETFTVFNEIPSYAIHLDNGRSFGKTKFDDDDILLPFRQCCVIRPTTLEKLIKFYSGPKSITEALHESLSKDPVHPVLAFKHYTAIERRMHKLMKYVLECMDKQSDLQNMIITEFHNPKIPELMPGEETEEDESEDDPPPPLPNQLPPQNNQVVNAPPMDQGKVNQPQANIVQQQQQQPVPIAEQQPPIERQIQTGIQNRMF